jgi:predicted TIM-barrel fold metal-dependent hydrolase
MHHYSCDSHLVEARDVFVGLESKLGTRAPRVERGFKGRPGDWLLLPGSFPVPVGRFGIAGHRLDDPATQELIARGYDGLNPGVADPHLRLKDQERDGIVGEVMYPSLNMVTFTLEDREVVHEVFRRHNDYCIDYCSVAPERLIAIGCLPLPDVDEALLELKRAASRGVKGFAIPCAAPIDKPYRHADYDPFWEVASDLGVPLTMHIFTGVTWDMGLPAHWGAPGTSIKGYTLAHTSVCNTVTDLICGGVVERFPGLRFVVAEFETGWLAHFLQRLDHATYRTPHEAVDYLKLKPSEYFRRNFHVTFEDDLAGILTRELIGVDCMLWGNDYPHHDSIWPHSIEILDRILARVPDDERRKLVWDNVIRLYDIDEKALTAA